MTGPKDKSFAIPKLLVWEAWRQVKANKGAPGVDEQDLDAFEADLENNLYKVWNRMSSGTWFPPPVRAVEIPKPHGDGVRMLDQLWIRNGSGRMSAADGAITRFIGRSIAATAGSLVIALALVSGAAGSTATVAGSHVRHSTCGQILPATKLDRALYGATPGGPGGGRLSGVKIFKSNKWIYPYNRPQPQAGTYCDYLWQPSQVPADYQAVLGPPTGPTLGAELVVGFQVSTKTWRAARAAAQSGGVGVPSDFPAGHVRPLHLGSGTQAFAENTYPGTGPTSNNLAVYVLTSHHNYFAVYAWDASLAQLTNVAKTVLAYMAGGF
jgi:hypothetical protein